MRRPNTSETGPGVDSDTVRHVAIRKAGNERTSTIHVKYGARRRLLTIKVPMEWQSARAAANDGIADGNAGERRLGGEPVSGDRIKSTTPLIEIRKTESMVQRRLGEPRAMMEGGGGDGSHTADESIRRR